MSSNNQHAEGSEYVPDFVGWPDKGFRMSGVAYLEVDQNRLQWLLKVKDNITSDSRNYFEIRSGFENLAKLRDLQLNTSGWVNDLSLLLKKGKITIGDIEWCSKPLDDLISVAQNLPQILKLCDPEKLPEGLKVNSDGKDLYSFFCDTENVKSLFGQLTVCTAQLEKCLEIFNSNRLESLIRAKAANEVEIVNEA